MRGKTDGKKVNARPSQRDDDDEPWLGSNLSLAVFISAEIAIGTIAMRLAQPPSHQVVVAGMATSVAPMVPSKEPPVPFADDPSLSDADRVARWAAATGDAGRRPFVIVDKRHARVMAFDGSGRLAHSTAALLGGAPGDDSPPGIGNKPVMEVRPEERVTPAGRFVARLGRNLSGEDVVWVDYDAAVSMHRVRATNPAERRLQRLASETIADNRISYGCINLPVAFYEGVVRPLVDSGRTVVYVLPETRALTEVFALSGNVLPKTRHAAL